MVSSNSWKTHDFRSRFFCFSISTVYPPNTTLGVVIQYGKWSAHQGASFGMVSSHIRKLTDFRLQYFRQLAIDFPIKMSFGICSKELLTMRNRFLILPKPEKLHFYEFLRFEGLKTFQKSSFSKKCRKSILQHAILCKKIRRKRLYYQFWAKPSEMTCFCQNTFLTFLTFFIFSYFLYSLHFWATLYSTLYSAVLHGTRSMR